MASEMKIELRQISASTSEATIGRHQVLIDRPVAKGGSGVRPFPAHALDRIPGHLVSEGRAKLGSARAKRAASPLRGSSSQRRSSHWKPY
jgi:hypothetical protein